MLRRQWRSQRQEQQALQLIATRGEIDKSHHMVHPLPDTQYGMRRFDKDWSFPLIMMLVNTGKLSIRSLIGKQFMARRVIHRKDVHDEGDLLRMET